MKTRIPEREKKAQRTKGEEHRTKDSRKGEKQQGNNREGKTKKDHPKRKNRETLKGGTQERCLHLRRGAKVGSKRQ